MGGPSAGEGKQGGKRWRRGCGSAGAEPAECTDEKGKGESGKDFEHRSITMKVLETSEFLKLAKAIRASTEFAQDQQGGSWGEF